MDGRGLSGCRSTAVGGRRVGLRGQHRGDSDGAVGDCDGAATYGSGGGVRIVVGTGVCGRGIWVFVFRRGDAWRRSAIEPELGGVFTHCLGAGRYSLRRGRIVCGLCRGRLVFGFVRGRLVRGAAASAAKDEEGGNGAADDEHAGYDATDGARG